MSLPVFAAVLFALAREPEGQPSNENVIQAPCATQATPRNLRVSEACSSVYNLSHQIPENSTTGIFHKNNFESSHRTPQLGCRTSLAKAPQLALTSCMQMTSATWDKASTSRAKSSASPSQNSTLFKARILHVAIRKQSPLAVSRDGAETPLKPAVPRDGAEAGGGFGAPGFGCGSGRFGAAGCGSGAGRRFGCGSGRRSLKFFGRSTAAATLGPRFAFGPAGILR